ncbi:MAG: helix-turn-helix domain-containing protein [Gemmatimonadaceae bacterium]
MPRLLDEIRHTTSLGTWSLTRAQPADHFAGIVKEYWEVKGRLSPFREALLPNGFVEIMFNLGPAHRVFEGSGMGLWERSWFSGLQERSIFIESLEGTHLVSIRLHPLGATQILGVAAPSAANSIVDLETLIGADAGALRDRLLAADSPTARFMILEDFLSGRLSDSAIPEFVREAVERIESTHGSLRVADLHQELDVSRKHLAVSFTRYVGISSKAYAQIARFLWTLGKLRDSSGVDWSRLAAEAGYSDQSHLVRDFRRVGAASPTEYLRKFAPGRDALLEAAG